MARKAVNEAFDTLRASRAGLEKHVAAQLASPAPAPWEEKEEKAVLPVPMPGNSKLPALPGLDDVITGADPVRGRRITFDKGAYPTSDGTDLAIGTEAIVMGFGEAKVVFKNGRVVATYNRQPGQPLPSDDELLEEHGLEDPETWHKLGDQPVHPVRHNRYVYLRLLPDRELATLVLGSWSASKQVEALGQQIYQDSAELPPGCRPVIKFEVGRTSTRSFGKIPSPRLPVARWLGPDGGELKVASPDADIDDPIPPL